MRIARSCTALVGTLCVVVFCGRSPGAAPEFGEWQAPVILAGPINGVGTYGPAISRDGLTLFVTRGSGSGADIYVSQRPSAEDEWGAPVKLAPPVNLPDAEDMLPYLSRDEHWLFFTSNRPGGQGRDQWMAFRADTHDAFGWNSAVNIAAVNSRWEETSGSYWENDAGLPVLFFASNRLLGVENPGAGTPPGNDIYASQMQADGSFGAPALDTDLSLTLGGAADYDGRPMVRFDGREIVFVSNRQDGSTNHLWVARRDSSGEPWGPAELLAALVGTGANEWGELHPYLSPDGESIYFTRRLGATSATAKPAVFVSARDHSGQGKGQDR